MAPITANSRVFIDLTEDDSNTKVLEVLQPLPKPSLDNPQVAVATSSTPIDIAQQRANDGRFTSSFPSSSITKSVPSGNGLHLPTQRSPSLPSNSLHGPGAPRQHPKGALQEELGQLQRKSGSNDGEISRKRKAEAAFRLEPRVTAVPSVPRPRPSNEIEFSNGQSSMLATLGPGEPSGAGPAYLGKNASPPLPARPAYVKRPKESQGRTDFSNLMGEALASSEDFEEYASQEDNHSSGAYHAKRLALLAIDKVTRNQTDKAVQNDAAQIQNARPSPSGPTASRGSQSPLILRSPYYPQPASAQSPSTSYRTQFAAFSRPTTSSPSAFSVPHSPVAEFGPNLKIVPLDSAAQDPALNGTQWTGSSPNGFSPHLFSTQGPVRQSQSSTRLPRFEASKMASRQGSPFTLAELIMVGYLKEERNLGWEYIDKKMGRTTNCCATKFLRKPKGLKNPAVKVRLKYFERLAALLSILELDPDITQAIDAISVFIETGELPAQCLASFETLRAQQRPLQLYSTSSPQRPTLALEMPSGARPPSTSTPSSILARSSSFAPPGTDTNSVSIPAIPISSFAHGLAAFSSSNPFHPQSTIQSYHTVEERLRPAARTSRGEFSARKFYSTNEELASSTSEALSSVESDVAVSQPKRPFILAKKQYPEGIYVKRFKPHLSYIERSNLNTSLMTIDWSEGKDWTSTALHVDFNAEELEEILYSICARLHRSRYKRKHTVLEHIHSMVRDLSEPQICDIARYAKLSGYLPDRTTRSIDAFIKDIARGSFNTSPKSFRICIQPEAVPSPSISNCLLQRELGQSRRPQQKIQDIVYDQMNSILAFTGASGDICTTAWAPNGNSFAVGAACLVDESSMQYNRPNNLLFGDVRNKSLIELPDHCRPRKQTVTGVNASHAMHVSQDPRLFETVTMVDFAPDGSYMYSAGYDNHIRAYGLKGRSPVRLRWTANQDAKIDLLTASRHTDLFALGCQANNDPVRIYRRCADQFEGPWGLSSQRREKEVHPSCLRWGAHPFVSDRLLAGFSAVSDATYGETCLWDVEHGTSLNVNPPSGNVFDCNWSPNSALFVTAVAAYGGVNRGTHSFIRLYSPSDFDRWSRTVEFDCPARDINDVLFCPQDQHYIAAGGTDGNIYVWDMRNPDDILHSFSHGEPLIELDEYLPRELSDTGVRFCSWNQNRSRLHTGSSDGVIKIWDIFRAPEDAFVEDLATFNSGVYSGAFSPDFSKLLIGEVNGSLNILEAGVEKRADIDSFRLQSATPANSKFASATSSQATTSSSLNSIGSLDEDSGVRIGRQLRRSKQIKFKPLGGLPVRQAVQGRNYEETGYKDKADDALNLRALASEFQARMRLANPEHQCKLPLCREARSKVTAEEEGDSGRAVDRIPQALRVQASGATNTKMIPGMMKCTRCNGPARPRVSDPEQEMFPLCERCGFSCFRCGNRIKVSPNVERVACSTCGLSWVAGALGYTLNKGVKATAKAANNSAEKKTEGGLTDMGDLLHLVEEYHHSLWMDRPNSPPI